MRRSCGLRECWQGGWHMSGLDPVNGRNAAALPHLHADLKPVACRPLLQRLAHGYVHAGVEHKCVHQGEAGADRKRKFHDAVEVSQIELHEHWSCSIGWKSPKSLKLRGHRSNCSLATIHTAAGNDGGVPACHHLQCCLVTDSNICPCHYCYWWRRSKHHCIRKWRETALRRG